MEFRIRMASDIPQCVSTLKKVHQADGYPSQWPDDPDGWLSPAGSLTAWVADDTSTGTILGHVCVVYGPGSEILASIPNVRAHQLASVSRLYVSPAARGKGLAIGSSLLSLAQSWTDAHGLTLTLDVVDDGGPAVKLYEKLGWRLLDQHVARWTTPEGRHPKIRIYRAPDGAGIAGGEAHAG